MSTAITIGVICRDLDARTGFRLRLPRTSSSPVGDTMYTRRRRSGESTSQKTRYLLVAMTPFERVAGRVSANAAGSALRSALFGTCTLVVNRQQNMLAMRHHAKTA